MNEHLLKIIQLHLELHKIVSSKLDISFISPLQYIALKVIHENENIRPKVLSEILKISPSNLAQLLSRLEEQNLIIREQNHDDKRTNIIKIQENGEKCLKDSEKNIIRIMSDMHQSLTETELKIYINILEKIINNNI